MLRTLTALLIFAATTSTSLAATPVTYFFYGFVTAIQAAGRNTPPLYAVVPISVTVDLSYPADTQQNNVTVYSNYVGGHTQTGAPISPILAATVNGVNVHGEFDYVRISQNANGIYGIEISSGSQMNGAGFDLNFTTTIAGVVKSERLPRQIFPGNFRTATFSTIVDPLDMYSGAVVE